MKIKILIPAVLLALALAPPALAKGGHYAFDGATPAQQDTIRKALDASLFDWSLVPWTVVVHVSTAAPTAHTNRGEIWINPTVLGQGQASWTVVQHEYAHQVDFAFLTASDHATLLPVLGGKLWWLSLATGYRHDEYGAERFASTLAWSYSQDLGKPDAAPQPGSESAAMAPPAFRAMLRSLLLSRGITAAAALPTALPSDQAKPTVVPKPPVVMKVTGTPKPKAVRKPKPARRP